MEDWSKCLQSVCLPHKSTHQISKAWDDVLTDKNDIQCTRREPEQRESQQTHTNDDICHHSYNVYVDAKWLKCMLIYINACKTLSRVRMYPFARQEIYTHTHTTVLWPFLWDHPGEPVPEVNFWTLWCKGSLTDADTLTIQPGATPSGVTSAHFHHPPIFFTGRMPFLPPNQQCQSTEGKKARNLLEQFSAVLMSVAHQWDIGVNKPRSSWQESIEQ